MAPSNISFQLVEKPSDDLIEEAVQMFCGLMHASPASLAFVGGDINLVPDMVRCMMKPIALIAGDMYTATDENGALVGYTLFLSPGQKLFVTEEQRQLGYYDFISKMSEEGQAYTQQVLGTDLPKVIDDFVGIKETELNTYWCTFAMVRADHQGKGIAKAMFQLAFQNAEKLGAPAVALATTNKRNVEIYEKIGMELKGHKVMTSPWSNWQAWIFMKDLRKLET